MAQWFTLKNDVKLENVDLLNAPGVRWSPSLIQPTPPNFWDVVLDHEAEIDDTDLDPIPDYGDYPAPPHGAVRCRAANPPRPIVIDSRYPCETIAPSVPGRVRVRFRVWLYVVLEHDYPSVA